MIPKKIHYCWFGGSDYPRLIKKCMKSWNKHLSEYEFVLWNEKNFDITCNEYVCQAYNAQKWAFVSDYVRLFALYNCGGIYLDTDVEILKPFDRFLSHGAFSGFENMESISTGVIGAQKNNKWIEALLEYYSNRLFLLPNGEFDITTNVSIITEISKRYGFVPGNQYQVLDENVHLYPLEYFCPISSDAYIINMTGTTYAIHHFAGSWLSIDGKARRIVRQIIGDKLYGKLKKIYMKKS